MKPVIFHKKVRSVGNALIITIPAEIVEALNLHPPELLEVSIKKFNTGKSSAPEKELKPKRDAVIEAFIKVINEKVIISEQELKRITHDPNVILTDDNFKITSGEVKELLPPDMATDTRIYHDINQILSDMGFTKVHKTTKGNKRIINYKEYLKFLESLGITREDGEKIISFKLIPPNR